jgi:hypothetical protein
LITEEGLYREKEERRRLENKIEGKKNDRGMELSKKGRDDGKGKREGRREKKRNKEGRDL